MRSGAVALVVAAAAHGARLPQFAGGSAANRRLLRLRGGEDGGGGEDAGDTASGGLTFQEVTDKLNRVPCFCVLRADGSLAPISADDGTAVHTWYLDPAEAREALELMAAAAADELDGEELSLGVTAMGTVFEMAGGWSGTPGEADAAGAAPDPSALRLLGPRASREPLEAQLRAAGLEPGSVVVSIVTHDDAQRDDGTLMPLFFSPADFEAGWVRLKGDDLEMPDGDALMVMELRSLCAQMLGPQGGQLKVAQFVASPDAYAASSEATPWPAPREEEGAEGEPPPEI